MHLIAQLKEVFPGFPGLNQRFLRAEARNQHQLSLSLKQHQLRLRINHQLSLSLNQHQLSLILNQHQLQAENKPAPAQAESSRLPGSRQLDSACLGGVPVYRNSS